MIKYFTVKRPDYATSKNGNSITTLPYNITSLQDVIKREIPVVQKLMIVTEQYILAKNIDDMMYQDNIDITKYLLELKSTFPVIFGYHCNELDQVTYGRYKSGIEKLLSSGTYTNTIIDMFNDYTVFPKQCRILPKLFYEPFLQVASKVHITNNDTKYYNALILTPSLVNNTVVYNPSFSHNCDLNKHTLNMDCNNQLSYLLKFNWTKDNWITLVDTIGTFCVTPTVPTNTATNRSLSHYVKALEHRTISPILNYSEVKNKLWFVLQSTIPNLNDTQQIESIQFLLEQMNYDSKTINMLTKSDITQNDIIHFNSHRELSFLHNVLLKHAMEAVESDDDDDIEETDDTEDNDTKKDDNEESNDLDVDDNMSESKDSTDDEFGDLDNEDDFDNDSDFGGDSNSNSGNDGTEVKVDEVPVPADPFSILFKIVTSETIDDFLFRNEAINAINAIILNPPPTLSADDLKFLTIWVTQWINLVSVETTKSVLSKLSVFVTDIE